MGVESKASRFEAHICRFCLFSKERLVRKHVTRGMWQCVAPAMPIGHPLTFLEDLGFIASDPAAWWKNAHTAIRPIATVTAGFDVTGVTGMAIEVLGVIPALLVRSEASIGASFTRVYLAKVLLIRRPSTLSSNPNTCRTPLEPQ